MIHRFSSRLHHLGNSFLNEKLQHALSYDRIAGYFSSSLLEVAGEAVESVQGKVRIVCNSDLDPRDVETARAAEMALRQEWCTKIDQLFRPEAQPRFQRLFNLLKSGKLLVRVLPSESFGLIHGKAGVITLNDGKKTSFLGSTNESISAWSLNYELIWEDDAEEAVRWVQEEFDALWNNPMAVPLSGFIIQDTGRLARRKIISLETWKQNQDGANIAVESPVYRSEFGLWAHQKYFIKKAFYDHLSGRGARYLLADMVGLGKTIQLALSAQLMALHGDKPILVIVPKTLLWQWQDEMMNMLDLPSAVWDGKQWVDENGMKYFSNGLKSVKKCPRRIGIISQGLIFRGGEITEHLLNLNYECVIVDESHRARRQNLRSGGENDHPKPNNLMHFLLQISSRTKSMLLATATPVQLYPVEAFDLLYILSKGSDHVLGNEFSLWQRDKSRVLRLIQGLEPIPESLDEIWEWIRNPLPFAEENEQLYGVIRRRLAIPDNQAVLEGSKLKELKPSDENKLLKAAGTLFRDYNPFIRNIIRRTREFLETTIDPETMEPYLKPVRVELFGEGENEAIVLPGYLKDAYQTAEEFSEELGNRLPTGGFMKTMLLRRIGSSIIAGENTAHKLLTEWDVAEDQEPDFEHEDEFIEITRDQDIPASIAAVSKTLTSRERELLERLITQLEANREHDPKYYHMKQYLIERKWIDPGSIIFSQYYDTVYYMASMLSTDIPEIEIGLYAGGNKSGVFRRGIFTMASKELLKNKVREGKLKIMFGTDAASEGLNLQRLGTLINLDLPWNPTRLEQRKGRIQRIGQLRETVYIYNMRYKDSVEDRVHQLLSGRLESIYQMFGQIPDVLEDVWINIAEGRKEKAQELIDTIPDQHPFEIKYNKIEKVDWESCAEVLNDVERKEVLLKSW